MAEIEIDGTVYKITCNMHDCDKGLHSFKTNKTLEKQGLKKGCCRNCRSALIDWGRLYTKDISDIEYTKSAFKFEMIRNCFWSVKTPTPEMVEKIKTYSAGELDEVISRRLHTTLYKPRNQNIFDGRQTPIDDNNLIHWAQHATGTCCRSCLEEWYGINENTDITTSDYNYIQKVVMAYIKEKVDSI